MEHPVPQQSQQYYPLHVSTIDVMTFFEKHLKDITAGPLKVIQSPTLFGWNTDQQKPMVYFPCVQIGCFYFQGGYREISHFLSSLMDQIVSYGGKVYVLSNETHVLKQAQEIFHFLKTIIRINRGILEKNDFTPKEPATVDHMTHRIFALTEDDVLHIMESKPILSAYQGISKTFNQFHHYFEDLQYRDTIAYHQVTDMAQGGGYVYIVGNRVSEEDTEDKHVMRLTDRAPINKHDTMVGDNNLAQIVYTEPCNVHIKRIFALPMGFFAVSRMRLMGGFEKVQEELVFFNREGKILGLFVLPDDQNIHHLVCSDLSTFFLGIHYQDTHTTSETTAPKCYSAVNRLKCNLLELELITDSQLEEPLEVNLEDSTMVIKPISGHEHTSDIVKCSLDANVITQTIGYQYTVVFESKADIQYMDITNSSTGSDDQRIMTVFENGVLHAYSTEGKFEWFNKTNILTPNALPVLLKSCSKDTRGTTLDLPLNESDNFFNVHEMSEMSALVHLPDSEMTLIGDLNGQLHLVSPTGGRYQCIAQLNDSIRALIIT